MTATATNLVAQHSRKLVFATLFALLLTVGAAGDAVAHNPAGFAVPGCENGAEAVAQHNPNCHGK